MFEDNVLDPVSYHCEAWILNTRTRKRIHDLETECLQAVIGVR